MRLELVQGCTSDSFEVDGKPVVDFSIGELKKLLEKQFLNVLKHDDLGSLYRLSYHIAEDFYDHLETSEPCECCGDSIWTYTTKL